MNRVLVPWVMALAILVAATGAVWLFGLLMVIGGLILIPFGLGGVRRSGMDLPPWMRWGPPR
jgi:hypothetical protein